MRRRRAYLRLKQRHRMKKIRIPRHEEQFPGDLLYHPSPALKRLEKIIVEHDFNPSKRKQREIKQIMDEVDNEDFDNENDT